MEQPAAPPKRSSFGLAVLAGVAVLGSLVGALLYQMSQNQKPPSLDTSGFDVSQVSGSSARPVAVSAQPAAPQSGLSMISGIIPGMNYGKKVNSANPGGANPGAPLTQAQAAGDFTSMCRAQEGTVRAMAEDYTRRYPAIAQYGRDWMGYPDLKKLNDDYMRDHDPVAFLRGLSKSDNFGKLVAKYARDPSVQAFAKEVITHAPSQLTQAGLAYVKKDNLVGALMDKVTGALGLPPGMLSGMMGGGEPPKIDANQVMGQMLNSNPQMKQAMDNPQVQQQLQQQGFQQQLNQYNQQQNK